MAKREVRYENYRIGRDVYTVKLTHLPQGVVYVQVMKWHLPPRTFWERISEWWKYTIEEHVWDPLLTDASLDEYCIAQCEKESDRRIRIQRGFDEWNAL